MKIPFSGGRRPGALRPPAGALGVALLVGAGLAARQEPSFAPAGVLPAASVATPLLATSPAAPSPAAPSPATPSSPAEAPVDPPAREPLGALVDGSFAPKRITVPSLRTDAPVIPVKVDRGGGLQIPPDPSVVGWWSGGASPGSPVGTVVVAGHVDTAEDGPGALFRLGKAPIGARVTISGPGDATAVYVVVARRRYLKASLPWRSLFAQGESPRLVLVTCGGNFDRRTGHYADNVVVVATPV